MGGRGCGNPRGTGRPLGSQCRSRRRHCFLKEEAAVEQQRRRAGGSGQKSGITMEVMVNAVTLSTDCAWTGFEIKPGPKRIKSAPFKGKRVKGIEPSCPAWEAGVLPLNYTRVRTEKW